MSQSIPAKPDRQHHCASILLRFNEDGQPTAWYLQSADLSQQQRLEPLVRLLSETASAYLSRTQQTTV